jgi:hypothetical protein
MMAGMARHRFTPAMVAAIAFLPALVGLATPAAIVRAAATLPAVPAAWPFTTLQIGFADPPGGAPGIAATGMGLRYQYLAGGVNTGGGGATWNTNGQFVTWYV